MCFIGCALTTEYRIGLPNSSLVFYNSAMYNVCWTRRLEDSTARRLDEEFLFHIWTQWCYSTENIPWPRHTLIPISIICPTKEYITEEKKTDIHLKVLFVNFVTCLTRGLKHCKYINWGFCVKFSYFTRCGLSIPFWSILSAKVYYTNPLFLTVGIYEHMLFRGPLNLV